MAARTSKNARVLSGRAGLNPRKVKGSVAKSRSPQPRRAAVGPWSDLAIHTIGWRAFQDLCSQLCEVILKRPVEIFREAKDGGQDAVFLIPSAADTRVGTIQCKYSSDANRSLKISDLNPELDNVKELVRLGQADTYVLLTSMSVEAGVALALRQTLLQLGVKRPHIFGKQFVVRTIRSSRRLRALVPQVYGLGDLTSILDQRLAEQSRALLDHWIPKLRTYVPTKAHRAAVRALSEHGIVLLLGNPSSGKSAIGAILSTIASENPNHTVLALTSPRDFELGWNPDDPGRFFWVDDAFGANVLRDDFVQDWATTFRKVQAAISKGNRFLLTSRKHIYEAAKRKLGQRNLPVFINDSAVVDVGSLSSEEKAQILYNHINYGRQSQSWKRSVKPFLPAVAAVPNFLPGIAERLGDPTFTRSLSLRENALVRFMEEPREHLVDTINALDDASQAALILVYVHQGSFKEAGPDVLATTAVTELTGLALPKILEAFADLKGSFVKAPSPSERVWSFAHPTISDALTEILRQKPHMMAALLRGVTIDTILSGFVCEGAGSTRDALIVPQSLNDHLVGRLLRTPDQRGTNWSLFAFLAYRATDEVLTRVLNSDPRILYRSSWSTDLINENPHINAVARAHRLGLVEGDLRNDAADTLESAALQKFDLSYFDDSEILALIPPSRLLLLGMRLRTQSLLNAEALVNEIADDADLDEEPSSHFEQVGLALATIERLAEDSETEAIVGAAREHIQKQVRRLAEKKKEKDEEESYDDDEWEQVTTVPLARSSESDVSIETTVEPHRPRSIFDDVDQI